MKEQIDNTLKYIEEQIGLKLKLYSEYETYKWKGKTYFYVYVKDSIWTSDEYSKLESYSKIYNKINVMQSGYKRAGISIIK